MAHCNPHYDAHHVAIDHHEISSLQHTISGLIKNRSALQCIGSKSQADVAELQRIEEELRLYEAKLVAQMEQQERDANASHEELKASLRSIQGLLTMREQDLARQQLETTRLAGINEVLDMKNQTLDLENQRLNTVNFTVNAKATARYNEMECQVIDLEKHLANLTCDPHYVHHAPHYIPSHFHAPAPATTGNALSRSPSSRSLNRQPTMQSQGAASVRSTSRAATVRSNNSRGQATVQSQGAASRAPTVRSNSRPLTGYSGTYGGI